MIFIIFPSFLINLPFWTLLLIHHLNFLIASLSSGIKRKMVICLVLNLQDGQILPFIKKGNLFRILIWKNVYFNFDFLVQTLITWRHQINSPDKFTSFLSRERKINLMTCFLRSYLIKSNILLQNVL